MNLSRLRVAWNVALVRLGVRQVLPREAVNRVPVEECGEPLVPWGGKWVREGVARRLDEAVRRLPEGYALELLEGWRSPARQEELREEARAAARKKGLEGDQLERAVARWAANDSGHRTGGAVDVRLTFRGEEAFCGSWYLEFAAGTASGSRVGAEAERNRRILHRAMRAAGFANYPAEWWHFAFGDRLWAAYRGEKRAVYGPAEGGSGGGWGGEISPAESAEDAEGGARGGEISPAEGAEDAEGGARGGGNAPRRARRTQRGKLGEGGILPQRAQRTQRGVDGPGNG